MVNIGKGPSCLFFLVIQDEVFGCFEGKHEMEHESLDGNDDKWEGKYNLPIVLSSWVCIDFGKYKR